MTDRLSYVTIRKHLLIMLLFCSGIQTVSAQVQTSESLQKQTSEIWPAKVQPKISDTPVDIFCGMDLHYADVNFLRLYNTLVYLTPGIKWNMGKDWQLAAQAWLPIDNNGYDKRYNMIRLSTLALSKELHFPSARQHLKLSAGLFGKERWGADIKWMMPVNSWLMLQAQAGLTQRWALGFDWDGTYESEFKEEQNNMPKEWVPTGVLGARVYLRPWDTEFVLTGGRYLRKDVGVQMEVMRHFKYCTVSLYAQKHEKNDFVKWNDKESGGFKIIVMLDRKGWNTKTKDKMVTFRPASNFRLTYIAQSDANAMRMYTTDPEENERVLPMRIY